jgi:hypothetical protein
MELLTNLDTVWLFPEYLLGLAIWHTSVQTIDEKASEIAEVIAGLEDLSQKPLPVSGIVELSQNGWLPVVLAQPGQPVAQKVDPAVAQVAPGDAQAGAQAGAHSDIPAPPKVAPPKADIPAPGGAQAPAPGAIAPPSLAVFPTPDSIINDSRQQLKAMLPEINQNLSQYDIKPITMDDMEPFLADQRKNIQQSLDLANRVETKSSQTDFLNKSLTDLGWEPSKIASFQQALALPLPSQSAFPLPGEFEKALGQYSQKFSELMGLPTENANSLAQSLKNAAKFNAGDLSPELLNSQVNPNLKGLDLFSPTNELLEKRKFLDQMTSSGLEPAQAENLHASLNKINALQHEFTNLPLPAKTAQLKAMGPELDAALNLPEGSMAQSFSDNMDKLKAAAYTDPSIGDSLEALAANNPEIKRVLQPLNQLRMVSPQPYDSLVDMAKAAGLFAPALLLKIARLDPLNPQPSLESLTPPPEPSVESSEPPSDEADPTPS